MNIILLLLLIFSNFASDTDEKVIDCKQIKEI